MSNGDRTGKRRRVGRRRRNHAGRSRRGIRNHPARQRATGSARPGSVGGGVGARVRVRHHRNTGTRRRRNLAGRDGRRSYRRTRPSFGNGNGATHSGVDTPRGCRKRRCQAAIRCHGQLLDARRVQRRSDVHGRHDRAVRPGDRCRRCEVVDPRSHRHRSDPASDRNGDLATRRTPSGQCHPHRPLLRRSRLHRRVLPHRRELALRLHRRRSTGPHLPDTRAASRRHAGPGRELSRSLGRHQTASRRSEGLNYTWFETHVLEGPWHRGRVVLIGDAAHCCPPTVAQGGAQGLEDAIVLAAMVLAANTIDDALLDAFTDRRLPRARAVVEASVQIGTWMLEHATDADVPGVMGRVAALVSEAP
ncbi:FAD-dependent monooxygenase [Rhodococcus sp. I2R]|nr:FAD-dependent monooxygenase [Rhodococcus sp. I2R]